MHMPQYAKRGLPPGYDLTEFSPRTSDDVPHYQAYLIAEPEHKSPIYTRRRKAIDWCLLDIADRTVAQQMQTTQHSSARQQRAKPSG